MSFLAMLAGKKTYLGAGLGILAVIANQFGAAIPGIEFDAHNWLSDIFKMAMLATFRAGMAKMGTGK